MYNYIAVEGNIGAGKTTVAKMLASLYGFKLILEEHEKNVHLCQFYSDKNFTKKLEMELQFLELRSRQLLSYMPLSENIISDYMIAKSQIFADLTLSTSDKTVFHKTYSDITHNIIKPNKIIYLHRTIDNLISNILTRNRGNEQLINKEYLLQLDKLYDCHLYTIKDTPIIYCELGDIDLIHNANIFNVIVNETNKNNRLGVTSIDFIGQDIRQI